MGQDTLDGGADNDRLNGGWSDDLLFGGAGDDRLNGGHGHDTLDGGAGDDRITGGLGTDTFIFNGGHDLIRDFDTGQDLPFYNRPAEQIVIDLQVVETFQDILDSATQSGRAVTFQFSESDSLTLRHTQVAELDADMFLFVQKTLGGSHIRGFRQCSKGGFHDTPPTFGLCLQRQFNPAGNTVTALVSGAKLTSIG